MRRAPQAEAAGPFFRQHRRQGSVGAWERRRGVAPLVFGWPLAFPLRSAPRRVRGARMVSTFGSTAVHINAVVYGGTWGLSRHRARWTRPPQPFDPDLGILTGTFWNSDTWPGRPAGRLRASPEPAVLLGDRAAVPCRPVTCLERGPTTHGTIRTSHRSSEPRVVLSGPPLAGTDTTTNEAPHVTVTRRTGESGPELRYDRQGRPSGTTLGYDAQMRPRHSSSNVIATDVPGLPSASL